MGVQMDQLKRSANVVAREQSRKFNGVRHLHRRAQNATLLV